MDIICTLSEYYNFEAPIFVDNAESVTTLPKVNAQVIRLIKPEITDENRQKYSKLVIETESKNEYREAV
jgi:ribosome recycling factor